MTAAELRTKSVEELTELLKTTKKDIEKYANEVLKGKDKNVKKAGGMKKQIAKISTVLNERKYLKGTEEKGKNE
ncbi:MAG TPA: 50S ribosomal protein L29 [Candidatus Saccharimonadales bacterium]|nr:50S ribosomal protein L29 [Candidatus Saccharimonadales bacterium]